MSHPTTKTYLTIYVMLMLLLAATVMFAYVNLGKLHFATALVIAFIKAVLVILYFMHVRYSSRLTWLFAGVGFTWLGIMLALTLNDYASRGVLGVPGK